MSWQSGPGEAVDPPGGGADSAVAVAVSGAGARGAYEAGALSVILPALGARTPQFYVGASAGAINSLGFAALSHLDPVAAGERVLELWRGISQGDVFRSPGGTILRAAARLLLRGGSRRHLPVSLLDTAPLQATMARVLNWDQLHVNLRHGSVAACGVVATAKRTHRSTVFVECGPAVALPPVDLGRDIGFVAARLTPTHVVGSSAIPALFPAVSIGNGADVGADWYVDGGVRLNTPIRPALLMGARRLVVLATVPASLPAEAGDLRGDPPGVASGVIDVLRAVTVDPMVEDLRAQVRNNKKAGKHPHPQPDGCHPGTVEYVFAGPQRPDELGQLAAEVLRTRRCSPLARFVTSSPDLCELASHVLFHPDFIDGAIELGRSDAARQLRNGMVEWKCCTPPRSP